MSTIIPFPRANDLGWHASCSADKGTTPSVEQAEPPAVRGPAQAAATPAWAGELLVTIAKVTAVCIGGFALGALFWLAVALFDMGWAP